MSTQGDAKGGISSRANGSSLKRPQIGIVLGLALAAILVVVVAAETLLFRKALRLQEDLDHVVRSAERSTYLIGDVGHLLSRLQANVLETLTEEPPEVAAIVERYDRIRRVLGERLDELPRILTSEELVHWRESQPQVELFRATLDRALRLMGEGRRVDAELELDVVARHSRSVFDSLQELQDVNQRETHAALAAVDQLLTRSQLIHVLVAVLLFDAIATIVLTALRVLRRKEEQLARYLSKIEQANDDLEAFAGRVAHDVRNILAPLYNANDVLRLSAGEPKIVSETTAVIARVTRRAGDLLSGLLAFSRAGAPQSSALVRVDEELEAALEELAESARNVGAETITSIDSSLTVECEAVLLHVVLLNLLSNAFKFLDGRAVRRVEVIARSEGDSCVIHIVDTGPGIAPAALDHIFEPFFRVPGVGAAGSGIGLATVQRIIAAYGWQIEVTSAEGEGTRFRVVMPLARRFVTDRSPSAGRSSRTALVG